MKVEGDERFCKKQKKWTGRMNKRKERGKERFRAGGKEQEIQDLNREGPTKATKIE